MQSTAKINFDKSAKPLSPMNINDSVSLQTGKFWRPAKVISKHNARSYTVQTRDGAAAATYRRNRKPLMKTVENFTDISFNPNVLACSEISDSPNEPHVPSCSTNSSTSDRIPPDKPPTADAPYVTWFGRKVMPSKCFTADEWIKS